MVHKQFLFKSFVILINVVSVYLFTFALRIGDASRVTSIYQGMMVIAVLAGILILKERNDIGKKLLGTAITIIGVVLLS